EILNTREEEISDSSSEGRKAQVERMSIYKVLGAHHTNGTRRSRTLFLYSVYPTKFSERNLSSSRSRHMIPATPGINKRSPHHEPSASGIPSVRTSAPVYMGWRTNA